MADLTRILLVDDNPKYIEDVLPFYGYEVCTALNGEQALEILNAGNEFDLVLLDIMMPKLNGWDTLKAIRKNPDYGKIPVIIVTVVNDDKKMVSGLKLGADDYIVKPFILPNLLARIEAVLRRTKKVSEAPKDINVTINQTGAYNLLTPREKDVLLLLVKGATNIEIAKNLTLSVTTVKSHISHILSKYKLKNRMQLMSEVTQRELTY